MAETCHSRGQPAEVGEKSNTMAIKSPIQLQSPIAFRSSSAGKWSERRFRRITNTGTPSYDLLQRSVPPALLNKRKGVLAHSRLIPHHLCFVLSLPLQAQGSPQCTTFHSLLQQHRSCRVRPPTTAAGEDSCVKQFWASIIRISTLVHGELRHSVSHSFFSFEALCCPIVAWIGRF